MKLKAKISKKKLKELQKKKKKKQKKESKIGSAGLAMPDIYPVRVALVVGCDSYSNMNSLHEAENDAVKIYNILIDESLGGYDKRRSILLVGSDLVKLRKCLGDVLFPGSPIDVFTFFFAGHGGVKASNYYMCLSDADADRLSASALPLTDLFIMISEAKPAQSNVIIDACQAGGLVHDLESLIRPKLFGEQGTPSLSIFAASSSDQPAREGLDGGLATASICQCLSGVRLVQTSKPHLDLVEVGQTVSDDLTKLAGFQSPIVWGLNLSGPSRFSKNPAYSGELQDLQKVITGFAPNSNARQIIFENSHEILNEYLRLPSKFSPRRIFKLVDTIAREVADGHGSAPSFVRGLADTYLQRGDAATDIFFGPQVLAVCGLPLLPTVGHDDEVTSVFRNIVTQWVEVTGEALKETLSICSDEEYSLLSTKGGPSDLFYLPMRLSKILGYAGAYVSLSKMLKHNTNCEIKNISDIIDHILGSYAGSLVCVSESQAPYLLLMAHGLSGALPDFVQDIFGYYFYDFVERRGIIASSNIDSDKVFEFIMRRIKGEFENAFEITAHPCELFSVLMYMASTFSAADAVDPHMRALDHLPFNVFVPRDHRMFADERISDGINVTFQVGADSGFGVFKLKDFADLWQSRCIPRIRADRWCENELAQAGAVLAALMFPNRVPWLVTQYSLT